MNIEFRNLNADEIEARVQKVTDNGVTILLYKNARCDMNLLDETVGAFSWMNDYREVKGNMYCGIAIKDEAGEWIWKWDCGTESNQEAEKGEASDSFKRAGFRWGIGRALYTSPFIYFPMSMMKDKYDRFKVTEIVYSGSRIASVTILDTTSKQQKTYTQDVEVVPAKKIEKTLSATKQKALQKAFEDAGYKEIKSLLTKYKHNSLAEFTDAEYEDAMTKLGATNGD